jgi:hypothetical protein
MAHGVPVGLAAMMTATIGSEVIENHAGRKLCREPVSIKCVGPHPRCGALASLGPAVDVITSLLSAAIQSPIQVASLAVESTDVRLREVEPVLRD